MTKAEIASRAFLQFNDISGKFSTTARASGEIDLSGVGSISIENATIAFAFGLGIIEVSDKIYFNELSSATVALHQNAQWQRVGVMDISIPVVSKIDFSGLGLSLNPIISITSSDLFTPNHLSINADLNLE
jgi:hypothetical protein